MRKDKKEALELRKSGLSYNQISDRLNIPKSTLSTWLKNIYLSEKSQSKLNTHIYSTRIIKLIERNRKKTEVAQKKHENIRKIAKHEAKKLEKNPLFLTGLALYWGEGYKKGSQGSKWKSIDFANSDPEMIKVMMKFFLKFLPITKNDIKVQLMLHNPDTDIESIVFWKNITGLDDKNFFKTSHAISKSSKNKSVNLLQYGTIHIRINNVTLFFKLMGWIDFIKEKFKN